MNALALLARHAGDQAVAFGAAGTKTAAELLADAARIARALPAPTKGSHVLLVAGGDRYAVAAALVGALARGHAVALPPNLRRESVLAVLERSETVAMLHDTDSGHPIRLTDLLGEATQAAPTSVPPRDALFEPPLAHPLDSPFAPGPGLIATVFTSGSTGPMLASPKTAENLLGEALTLARTFGIGPGDRLVGCVPPTHIYGLLFTLLVPLLSGAAFLRETPLHAEAIAHAVTPAETALLVTVPVQLRALAALRAGALAGLRRVVSSTGPLPDPVARAFRERHGLAIQEVFGSTETGGIALRERTAEPAGPWRALDGVRVAPGRDGRLAVDSPHLHPDLPRPYETADLVRFEADGRFTHLGRTDGIVKIAGRRVSLQEVEEALRQQPSVEDVAVVAIEAEGGRGQQLLAVVAPADCDVAPLRASLLERFEPSCLPRRWLAVDALPREENGKLPRARLLALFGRREGAGEGDDALVFGPIARTLGEAGGSSASDGHDEGSERVVADVKLPVAWSAFEGHFDGFPVLAGALQLKAIVLPLLRRAFPSLGAVETLERVKFSGRIVPGDALTVVLERRSPDPRLRFEIRRGDELCSSGTLGFFAASVDAPGPA